MAVKKKRIALIVLGILVLLALIGSCISKSRCKCTCGRRAGGAAGGASGGKWCFGWGKGLWTKRMRCKCGKAIPSSKAKMEDQTQTTSATLRPNPNLPPSPAQMRYDYGPPNQMTYDYPSPNNPYGNQYAGDQYDMYGSNMDTYGSNVDYNSVSRGPQPVSGCATQPPAPRPPPPPPRPPPPPPPQQYQCPKQQHTCPPPQQYSGIPPSDGRDIQELRDIQCPGRKKGGNKQPKRKCRGHGNICPYYANT